MFGNKSKPSRIYAFKTKRPTRGLEVIEGQMRLGNTYRNRLVELETGHAAHRDRILRAMNEKLVVLDATLKTRTAELDAIESRLKRSNAKARSRVASAEDRASLRNAKAATAAVRAEIKRVRKETFADPSVQVALKESKDLRNLALKDDRHVFSGQGLFWGNYLKIEGNLGNGKGSKKEKNDERPGDGGDGCGHQPGSRLALCSSVAESEGDAINKVIWKGPLKKRPWRGDGSVSVQLQGGLAWSKLLGAEDQRARVVVRDQSIGREVAVNRLDRDQRAELRGLELARKSLTARLEQEPANADSRKRMKKIAARIARLDALRGREVRILPGADPASRRSRENPMADLWLRIGSQGRSPVWAIIPFRLPREIPANAMIKWISLHREIVGTHERWEVQFTLSRDSWEKPDNATSGIAAIDLNWRVVPDGLRVATLVGDDGVELTLTMPKWLVASWGFVESIHSAAARNFNDSKGLKRRHGDLRETDIPGEDRPVELALWMEGRDDLPPEFREKFKGVTRWLSAARFGDAIRWWADHRVPGDDSIFEDLTAWRERDRHLLDYARSQAMKARRTRAELYRRFAAVVRRRYRTIIIEKLNLSDMRRNPGPEGVSDAAFKAYANVASVGTLAQFLKEAASETLRADARGTTKRCHVCGVLNEFDAGRELVHRCSACGVEWDQDRNAAINLLRGKGVTGPFEVTPVDWRAGRGGGSGDR